ncbi:hypothetical protein CDL15_Pgr009662 [Punica granatum]|uniref:NADP-dependent oxidoreductase domain-containing protein n=1 Tax=Punica granatum TaxID=22663 RepID=A0A218WT22_PUNGR|nr:hypothetical protein CDL15_Pgr009662 [Punica granatum]
MADKIPTAELVSSGGRKIPLLGFGTATFPLVPFEETKAAVLEAIKLGYRHFDTAAVYLSEEPIGQAIKEALELGLVNLRDEFFITSKLWCTDAHPGLVIPALQKSLEKLKLEYLDLYLIHWPVSMKPGVDKYPIKKENLLPMDFKGVWADMEECQRKGLTKSIGLSNFSCKKVGGILANAKIPPAINQVSLSHGWFRAADTIWSTHTTSFSSLKIGSVQAVNCLNGRCCKVELNPLWQQRQLRKFCASNGILLTAYSALGAKGTFWGSNRVMDCPELKEIAEAKGKTVAQARSIPLSSLLSVTCFTRFTSSFTKVRNCN